ncbi:DNA ligase 1-like [Ostrinia furnacalis]|uniref:DNA ligase 1-like n=1 Tax=Ostrinia furnacalis TaxID=93504 RepID=UPI00103970FA|nr:DNA ligase 1-like [Ostrinia furnacalis]
MARALLVALACAACAGAAARYGDYSGARMPQYGGGDYDAREHGPAPEPDDYRGHSPDAPAALDYKYEEDPSNSQIGKTESPPGKEVDEAESWQHRPARRHKKSRAVDDIHTDPADRFDPDDDFPKPRSSNRFTKHHTRLKSRKFERHDDELPKYSENHKIRNDDSDTEEELQIDKDFRNDKRKSFEEDRYAHRAGGERVVRRKPRDRQLKKEDGEESAKSDSDVDRWMLPGMGRAPGPGPLSERLMRRRPPDESMPGPREPSDEDEPILQGEKAKGKSKGYDDYSGDYYDMKRVMNIKKKLPSLLRRTTVTEESLKLSTRSLEDYLSNRRIFLPPSPAKRTTTEPPPTESHPTSTTTTTTVTTSSTTAKTANISKEMSLAEKSRLSILKKAQRKESMNLDTATKKPPVLLQVTHKLPTLVMVEPPSSAEPWMRAQAVFADSPARLDQVKRLMRHKLVANAKNIHELTDNWDDLVCDYIDMSLLDAVSSVRLDRDAHLFTTVLFQVIIIIR